MVGSSLAGVNSDVRATKSPNGWVYERVERMSGGTGTSDYMADATPGIKWLNFYCQSTATSGDSRVLYARLNLAGAGTGAGEAVRAYTVVDAALTGGGVHGIHASIALGAAGSEAGLSAGVRATLEAAAATKTLTGTYASLQVDSYLGAGNTVNGQKVSFIRAADVGAVKMPYLFDLSSLVSDAAGAYVSGTHAGTTVGGVIRVITGFGVGYIKMYSD